MFVRFVSKHVVTNYFPQKRWLFAGPGRAIRRFAQRARSLCSSGALRNFVASSEGNGPSAASSNARWQAAAGRATLRWCRYRTGGQCGQMVGDGY